MLQTHLSYETHQRAVEIFSKCVCFLGTSISKICFRILGETWSFTPTPTAEVWTNSEKP